MNEEKWTPSLSPYQEWRLHNGEGKVPEWFVVWSRRVYEEAQNELLEVLASELDGKKHNCVNATCNCGENGVALGNRYIDDFVAFLNQHKK